ncbi:MAG TPA: acylphosphatase [Ktedonosporobacter sp.]|jgi:acylphosphatase|nr:acylphosphatase [Ktedonosporobacter sp.]
MMIAMSQNDTRSREELQAIVRGFVQGVGFRDFVVRKALALGLRGWTRNNSNGDVEVVAQGMRPALERLLAQLRQGPAAADVEEVQVSWREPTEHISGFHVRF